MEIDWTTRQLQRYAEEGQYAISYMAKHETDEYFLERVLDLLRTYVEGLTHVSKDPASARIIVRLALVSYYKVQTRGYWARIVRLWPSIYDLAEWMNDFAAQAELMKETAVVKSNQGDWAGAMELFRYLLHHPRFVTLSPNQRADILFQTGVTFIQIAQYRQAYNVLMQCRAIALRFDGSEEPRRMNEHDGQPDVFRIEPPLWELHAYTLDQLGNIAMIQGQIEEARYYYQKYLDMLLQHGQEDDLACAAYQSLGRLWLFVDRFDEAIPLLEKGLEIRRKLQEKQGITTSLLYLAMAYVETGRLHQAEMLIDEAFILAKELQMIGGIAFAHLVAGSLEAKRGRMEAAIVQWKQVMAILDTHSLPTIGLPTVKALLLALVRTRQIGELASTLISVLRILRRQRIGLVAYLRWTFQILRINQMLRIRK